MFSKIFHKNNIIKSLLFIVMMITLNVHSQNNFVKVIANNYGLSGNYGIQCKDKGYVAVGSITDSAYADTTIQVCSSCPGGYDTIITPIITSDIFVVKLNSNGDSIWSHKYGGIQNENGIQIIEATDSSLYVLGTDSLSNGLLIKLKPNGNIVWIKTYLNIYLQQIIYKQNKLLLLGETNFVTSATVNINVLDCDTSGSIITQKEFGIGSTNDYFISADTCINDGLLILGKTSNTSVLYEINNQLDTLWTKSYFNTNYRPIKIVNSDDSTATILYSYGTIPIQNLQPRVIKTSLNNGNIIWQQNYFDNLNYDIVSDIIRYDNNEIVIAGTLNDNLIGDSNQMYLMIIDKKGNQLSLTTRTMFDSTYNSISSIKITSDNGMLITGTKDNTFFICKTDPYFVPVIITENKMTLKSIIPFPNPARNDLNINVTNQDVNSILNIYDRTGRKLINVTLSNINNHINIATLNPGLYIYEIYTKEKVYKGKILKM